MSADPERIADLDELARPSPNPLRRALQRRTFDPESRKLVLRVPVANATGVVLSFAALGVGAALLLASGTLSQRLVLGAMVVGGLWLGIRALRAAIVVTPSLLATRSWFRSQHVAVSEIASIDVCLLQRNGAKDFYLSVAKNDGSRVWMMEVGRESRHGVVSSNLLRIDDVHLIRRLVAIGGVNDPE